jgi:hypothetical protein
MTWHDSCFIPELNRSGRPSLFCRFDIVPTCVGVMEKRQARMSDGTANPLEKGGMQLLIRDFSGENQRRCREEDRFIESFSKKRGGKK